MHSYCSDSQVSAAQLCLAYAWLPFRNTHKRVFIRHLPWCFIKKLHGLRVLHVCSRTLTVLSTHHEAGMLQAVKKSERKRSNRLSSEETADASQMAQPTQTTGLQLQRAMEMYGLTGSELFCEVRRDTRCLMGWNDSTIVLAFRGTASMTNALSDLQVNHLSWAKHTALSF